MTDKIVLLLTFISVSVTFFVLGMLYLFFGKNIYFGYGILVFAVLVIILLVIRYVPKLYKMYKSKRTSIGQGYSIFKDDGTHHSTQNDIQSKNDKKSNVNVFDPNPTIVCDEILNYGSMEQIAQNSKVDDDNRFETSVDHARNDFFTPNGTLGTQSFESQNSTRNSIHGSFSCESDDGTLLASPGTIDSSSSEFTLRQVSSEIPKSQINSNNSFDDKNVSSDFLKDLPTEENPIFQSCNSLNSSSYNTARSGFLTSQEFSGKYSSSQ